MLATSSPWGSALPARHGVPGNTIDLNIYRRHLDICTPATEAAAARAP